MQLESVQVQVCDIVASLVVTLVQSNACSASKEHCLLRCLVLLGAGEQSTGWNAQVKERAVV